MSVATAYQTAALTRLANLALPGRVHLGLATPEPLRRLPSGVPAVDALLGGGIPRGRVSEICGPLSSGKTALLLTLLATTTRSGEVTACVDLADALHPESAARAGIDLQRLLWIRPARARDGWRCTEVLLQAGGFALIVLDLGATVPQPLHLHVWPRLLHAAEAAHSAVVVLAPQRVAGSFAGLSLQLQPRRQCWQHGVWPLFDGFESVAVLEHSKLGTAGGWAGLTVRERIENRRWS